MTRDYQMKKAYLAEYDCILSHYRTAAKRVLKSPEDMQAYVNRIVRSKFWRENSVLTEIVVSQARTYLYYLASRESRYIGSIRFPLGRTVASKIDMLHEAAHLMAGTTLGHGPVWAGGYVAILRRFMSRQFGNDMRDRFLQYGVDYLEWLR